MDKEAEYLDEVVSELDGPFAQAVKSAYAGVYDLKEAKDIAGRIGVKPPTLSKALRGAATMNAKTLRKILGQFESFMVRQRIAEAWQLESLGSELIWGGGPSLEGGTVKDIAELIAEKKPELALRLAMLLLDKTDASHMTDRLIEQAIYLAFRMDEPLTQAEVADKLMRAGEQLGASDLQALSLAVSARVLRRSGAHRKTIIPVWQKVLRMSEGLPAETIPSKSKMAFARDMVESEQLAQVMDEHRFRGGQEATLKEGLMIAERRTAKAPTPQAMRQGRILEASIYLSLGHHFKAEEVLEAAYEDTKGTRGAAVYTSLLYGRILTAKGKRDEAIDWYRRLIEACVLERDPYLQRLATQELTWLLLAVKTPSSA